MQDGPLSQHEWLRRWVGAWTFESECPGEGGEAMRTSGREVVRALGDLWIVGEGSGEAPDGSGSYSALLTIGFDPKAGRFVGSWVGSMMTHLWVYDGWLEGDELTLEAEGESFAEPGKVTKYRDITTLVGDDERRFRSEMLGPEGEWQQIMSAVYRREG